MDRIIDTLKQTLEGYAGKALNGYSYLTRSTDEHLFTVVTVGYLPKKRIVNIGLIVQVVGDHIIIEHDINNKPLVDALVQAGVPREQIILAYAGEPVEEPTTHL
jgi:hypothetical protein